MLTFDCLPIGLKDIAEYAQNGDVDDLLIIFAILGILSGIAGHHANEVSEYHRGRKTIGPITLGILIQAESGSGKGWLDNIILGEIKNLLMLKDIDYLEKMQEFKIEKNIYEMALTKNKENITCKSGNFEIKPLKIYPPKEPINPNFIMDNFTIESMQHIYRNGSPHLFIYSTEGNSVLSSRAFQESSLGITLAFFNQIYSGENASTSTLTHGYGAIFNKRISLLLMVQEPVYQKMVIKFEGLGGAGTYQRIFPIKTSSKRKYMEEEREADNFSPPIAHIITDRYKKARATLVKICERKPPLTNGILYPINIEKTPAAHKLWRTFYREQNNILVEKPNDDACSFISRIPETVSRYATLFQLWENFYHDTALKTPVSVENMEKAITICRYGLKCQIEEFVIKNEDDETLDKILKTIGSKTITRRDIMRAAPKSVRKKDVLDKALRLLLEDGAIIQSRHGYKKLL